MVTTDLLEVQTTIVFDPFYVSTYEHKKARYVSSVKFC